MSKKTDNDNDIVSENEEEMTEELNGQGEAESDTVKDAEDEKESEEEVRSPKQVIDDYKKKIEELDDRYLRLAAEFDNYKKRTSRQFEEILKNSNENIIIDLLEVIDNFERALAAASESADYKSLHSGTELIYQSLFDLLKKQGLKPIGAVGEKFNPSLHEAMMQMESDEYPEGMVMQEMVKGYTLNGKVIRYAKVIVSKGPADGDQESD
ncbi:MAG: nucleotide exchange factor GrpE [Candidatus Zixiibacteriota bacterium]|nr:MAG: nucleotide exchange factor GrpE [candidate division Zixibacteria bacterium]